jgi:hypothetical protein
MALQKLTFTPGVNRDQTNYANEGGWYACDKVRFRSGYPQKLGGWVRYGTLVIQGACRQMFNWVTTYSDNLMGLGTNEKLYIEVGGNLYDITPIRATLTNATTPSTGNSLATTNGSRTITVNIAGWGGDTGDWVTISGATTFGGIPATELNGNYKVTRISAGVFTYTVASAATSTVAAGGGTSIVMAFEISAGNPIVTFGYGWGTSTWGRGAWGSGSTVPINLPQKDWWIGNFDNDMIANVRNGAIYIWERGIINNPTIALTTRAVLLSSLGGAADVPTEVMQTLVSQNDKHLLAFGCTPYGGGEFDPLLIRWATQDNPTVWTPLPTNSAGFLRVSRGSNIVCAVPMRQEIIVFTNATLSSLQFLGTSDVFGIQELADTISIIGPRAVTTVNNTAYWMGHDKFYAYSGRVETLPSTLRNHVFNNINYEQADQIISGTNEGWNEVWWMYPTADSNYNNAYVIYNHLENVWYYGTIARTAWLDTPLRNYGQAVDTDPNTWTGVMYNQEQGANDGLLPMVSYIQSSDFDISDGEQFTLIKRIIPDLNFAGSTAAVPRAYMTVTPRNFPGAAYMTEAEEVINLTSAIPVEQYTNQVFIRARARQMGLKISSVDLDTQWQLGAPRIDGRPDGKR